MHKNGFLVAQLVPLSLGMAMASLVKSEADPVWNYFGKPEPGTVARLIEA